MPSASTAPRAAGLALAVLTLDEFGESVARWLASVRQVDSVHAAAAETLSDEAILRHDVLVVAAGTHDPAVLDDLDVRVLALGRRWLPVVHGHPYLQVGPVFGTATGPCHRCLTVRADQLYGRDAATTFPDPTGPGSAVSGLPDHAAALVAGLADRLLVESSAGPAPGRAGTPMNIAAVPTMLVRTQRVVAVHGCPRCRVRRPRPGGRRGIERLLQLDLWPGVAS